MAEPLHNPEEGEQQTGDLANLVLVWNRGNQVPNAPEVQHSRLIESQCIASRKGEAQLEEGVCGRFNVVVVEFADLGEELRRPQE